MMTRKSFTHLDTWLAVQEVTGRRFETAPRHSPHYLHCTMVAYVDEHDMHGGAVFAGLDSRGASPLFAANDVSGGDPGAVRRKLHEMFPEFVVIPVEIAEEVSR